MTGRVNTPLRVAVDAAVYLAALGAIAVVINYFAHQPAARAQIDATKTRAYSLSDQTRAMLENLEGEWTVAVVLVEDEADRAIARQVNEVLRRFGQAAGRVR